MIRYKYLPILGKKQWYYIYYKIKLLIILDQYLVI